MSGSKRMGWALPPWTASSPKPPRRVWRVRVGEVWESDGVLWVMSRLADDYGSWKQWVRYSGSVGSKK